MQAAQKAFAVRIELLSSPNSRAASIRKKIFRRGGKPFQRRLPLCRQDAEFPKHLDSRAFEPQEDEQWYELNSTLFKIKSHSYIARITTVHSSRSQVVHSTSVTQRGVTKEQLPIDSNRQPRFALIHIDLRSTKL